MIFMIIYFASTFCSNPWDCELLEYKNCVLFVPYIEIILNFTF